MTCMEKQLQELRRQLHDKIREERRLILEFEATLNSADAELHAEIERIQTSHLERRHAMMTSLAGLARSLGALPGGHLQSDGGQAIEHEPVRRQIAQVDEEYANDEAYEQTEQGAVDTASRSFEDLSSFERKLLEDMQSWAERASYIPDSKASALIQWLKDTLLKPDGSWGDHRVIIFTEYRTTQNWLQTLLAAEGLTSVEIAERLFISHRTVELHRANLMEKLHLRHQTDLVRYAIKRGILILDE